jgi:sirohydrochlorin cobaltochelatase
MTRAIILFAHGARDPAWSSPFEAVAERLRALQPGAEVRLAYLEFMSPSLVEAGHELAQSGAAEIRIVPMFLGAGGHVRKDLPRLLAALQQQHPQVTWNLQGTIGEAQGVIEALAREAAGKGRTP